MSDQEPLIHSQVTVSQYPSSTTHAPIMNSNPDQRKREVNGILFMALSSLAYSVNSLFVKLGSSYFLSFQIVFARSVFQLCFSVLTCVFLGINILGPRHLRSWLWLRGILGCLGLALYYYSITVLPLADVTVLFFTGPMFTSIMAAILLGEPFGGLDFIALFLCLIGVTLLSKPSFLVGSDVSSVVDIAPDAAWSRTVGTGAAILGEILASLAYLTVRKLGTSVHFLHHITYLGMASSIFSFVMAYTQNQLVPVGLDRGGFILFMIGATACAGQCLLNSGLQLAPMGPGSLMRNLDVVFAFIFGITIFHEIPDILSISGALLIVGCATIIGLKKVYSSRS